MSKYTYYIVSRHRDHHYPVLMANNGKITLNEAVRRAGKLEQSITRLIRAVNAGEVAVVRITEKEFRAKFPSFAPNQGGKKKKKP
jgi:undecaprenyl pyrophosphate synthase